MSAYKNLLMLLPEVRSPLKKGTLKSRMLWTLVILVLYLFLATIPLYGVLAEQASYFQQLELLLGAKIGKLLTLGIGPIVTSSIVLQLLKGSGILKFDLSSEEGKFVYSGSHKLLTFFFIIAEAIVYVAFGAVSHDTSIAGSFWIVALQLALGGFIVFYMDEIVKKWGVGSGVSLFIAAGIGQAVFILLLSPLGQAGTLAWPIGEDVPVGKLWAGMYYLATQDPSSLLTAVIGPVGITAALFFLIVFFQSVNVEIPLSFGRVRGQSMKWPLNFFYSGVIPIILISALRANFQLWASLLQNRVGESGFLAFISEHVIGHVAEGSGTPVSGIINWIVPIQIWDNLANLLSFEIWAHVFSYMIFMIFGATLFAYFWVQTSGQDSRSVAKQIIGSGLQIPGFRKDERIIQRVLDRYIVPLTIMGGIGIGILAASADILSALTSGTGILLLIMIIYQFYQQLARESMEDFSLLKKLMRK